MAEIMTLKDLADYLRMNERTVAKLVQEGKIPGAKVASQWRFSKEAIDKWFAGRLQQTSIPADQVTKPKVASLLGRDTVNLSLVSHTKDGILAEMADLVASAGRVSSASALLEALRERERLCSTGIGRQIAFLHPRRVVNDIVKEPVIAFGRSETPVDFDAVDGEPVRLFFLDCAPSDRMHLAVLARLSRLLADGTLVERLLEATTGEEAIAEMHRAEEAIAG